MGLLDDAIREHLELKRRRGADPSEVAREQQEALDPVPRHDSSAADLDPDASHAPMDIAPGLEDEALSSGVGSADPLTPDNAWAEEAGAQVGATGSSESSQDVQETAELDMEKVLEDPEETASGASGEPLAEESPPGEISSDAEAGLEDSRETPPQDHLWQDEHHRGEFNSPR